MEEKRVVVTGVGAITPIGDTVSEYWEALLSGINGVGLITKFDTTDYTARIAAELKNYTPEDHFDKKELRKIPDFCQYAIIAAREAAKDAQLAPDENDAHRVGVFIGSGMGCIQFIEDQHTILYEKGPRRVSPLLIPKIIPNMAAGYVSIMLGAKGPNMATVTACASGTHAIGESYNTIKRGDAIVMIAGGTEATITPLGVAGFQNMQAISKRNDQPHKASRPFDKERDGFVMGEGAGILILEELEHALNRGINIYCEIIGYGLSGDAYHITAPSPNGEGGARAMKMCLDNAGITPDKVDHINSHGTSTPLNDKVETVAIKTVFGDHAYAIPITSNKSMIGHLLGAAGAVEAYSSLFSIRHNVIPPTINYEFPDPECDLDYVPNEKREAEVNIAISNSLGFGGHNCTIAFRAYKK